MPIYNVRFPGLHEGQKEVVKSNARFKIVCCGRRWGKTKLSSAIAVDYALRGKKGWWLAPDYTQSNPGWDYVNALLKQIPMDVRKKSSPPRSIDFPTGGSIAFRTTQNENLLRGSGLDFMIIDEADFIDEKPENTGNTWHTVLRPSLADKSGSAVFISTPNIENGWFHKMFKKGVPGDPTHNPAYQAWTFPSYTNPFVKASEWDEMRVDMPSIIFRREILAEFISTAGARIKSEWLEGHYFQIPQDKDYTDWKNNIAVSMGVDLAISQKESADYVGVAILARDIEGKIYVLDVQRFRASFHEQIAKIRTLADKWQPDTIGVESNAYQMVMAEELLLQTRYTVIPLHSNKDKQIRFAPLEARYERRQVNHALGLPNEFEQELFGFPNAEHDDQIDAMSCAWAVLGEVAPAGSRDAVGAYSTSGMYGEHEDHNVDEFVQDIDLSLVY